MKAEQIITKKIMEFDKYANSYLIKFKNKSFLSTKGPLTSPAKTTLFVVVRVSHATRDKESLER